MKTTKTLYRIEKPEGGGMWYNFKGEPEGDIFRLCPDSKAVDIPMGYKSIHYDFGKKWQSAGDSIPMMQYWFTRRDAERLLAGGFKLIEMECTEYRALEHEVLFTKDGVVSVKELSIDDIWS